MCTNTVVTSFHREQRVTSSPVSAAGGRCEPPRVTASKASMADLGRQLWDAALNNRVSDVRRLVAAGADLQHRDGWWDQTPLHVAAICGHTDSVAVLLDAGLTSQLWTGRAVQRYTGP